MGTVCESDHVLLNSALSEGLNTPSLALPQLVMLPADPLRSQYVCGSLCRQTYNDSKLGESMAEAVDELVGEEDDGCDWIRVSRDERAEPVVTRLHTDACMEEGAKCGNQQGASVNSILGQSTEQDGS